MKLSNFNSKGIRNSLIFMSCWYWSPFCRVVRQICRKRTLCDLSRSVQICIWCEYWGVKAWLIIRRFIWDGLPLNEHILCHTFQANCILYWAVAPILSETFSPSSFSTLFFCNNYRLSPGRLFFCLLSRFYLSLQFSTQLKTNVNKSIAFLLWIIFKILRERCNRNRNYVYQNPALLQ